DLHDHSRSSNRHPARTSGRTGGRCPGCDDPGRRQRTCHALVVLAGIANRACADLPAPFRLPLLQGARSSAAPAPRRVRGGRGGDRDDRTRHASRGRRVHRRARPGRPRADRSGPHRLPGLWPWPGACPLPARSTGHRRRRSGRGEGVPAPNIERQSASAPGAVSDRPRRYRPLRDPAPAHERYPVRHRAARRRGSADRRAM
ncbi:MAG: hypothetical protein AVDCRST_MAG87-2115, partial [uncultured Thermomicrobiales bacterium]